MPDGSAVRHFLKFFYDFDFAQNVQIKFLQLFSGNPQLLMVTGTNSLDGIPGDERVFHVKPGYIAPVAGVGIAGIPLLCNLMGILMIQDRIEDGLFRQTGRKAGEVTLGDQIVFCLPYRAV